jgi:hypothetical protein
VFGNNINLELPFLVAETIAKKKGKVCVCVWFWCFVVVVVVMGSETAPPFPLSFRFYF